MTDLRDKMLQALLSSAPFISDAVMGYVSELEAQCAAMREALEDVPEMCLAAGDARVSSYRGLYERAEKEEVEYKVMLDKWAAALAPDAGEDLLERLRKAEASLESYRQWESNTRQANNVPDDMSLTDWASAVTGRVKTLNFLLDRAEAERVEAYPKYGFCRDAGCIPHKYGDHSMCPLCEAYQFHRYLRSNHMIREAE